MHMYLLISSLATIRNYCITIKKSLYCAVDTTFVISQGKPLNSIRHNDYIAMSIPKKHFNKDSEKPQLPDDDVLRLFSMRFCPFAHRVHLVLGAKNIAHHKIFIDLKEKPKWYIEYSPLGKVPALQLPAEEGQPALIESLVIADYLDEKYPQPKLASENPLQKAQDKILIERFNAVVGALYPIFTTDNPPEDSLTNCTNGLDIYEQELAKRDTPYFGGENPGMLDYMIWPWFERIAMLKYLMPVKFELDSTRFKQLIKWQALMLEDAAVKQHYLDGDMHAKFMRIYRTGNPNFDLAF